MNVRALATVTVLAATAGTLAAQEYGRRATITGGGRDGGRCTIAVLVDGTSEVEIRGDRVMLRDISGHTPEVKQFECTSPMPLHPENFAFRTNEGRGHMDMVRDPRDGESAVVRIEDREGGPGLYRFSLVWGRDNGDPRMTHPDERHFTQRDALKVCQDSIRDQAMQQFHAGNIQFRTTAETDGDRPDVVSGNLEIHNRDTGRDETYHFSCSVDYGAGRVRDSHIEPR